MRQDTVKNVLMATGMNNTELGEFFGVTRQTIHRWITQNELPEKYQSRLMNIPGKTLKLIETNGNIVGMELINKDEILEMANDSGKQRQELISALTTEELVQELTRRGWKVSLAQLPGSDESGK